MQRGWVRRRAARDVTWPHGWLWVPCPGATALAGACTAHAANYLQARLCRHGARGAKLHVPEGVSTPKGLGINGCH